MMSDVDLVINQGGDCITVSALIIQSVKFSRCLKISAGIFLFFFFSNWGFVGN